MAEIDTTVYLPVCAHCHKQRQTIGWRRIGLALGRACSQCADAIPIPLPPEPPRDRVIEAVDGDGKFVELWGNDGTLWVCGGHYFEPCERFDWPRVVGAVMREGWSLRSVPAENGEQ